MKPFFWVTIFVTQLEMTEIFLTMLINSNASQYAATFKTHWCIVVNCLILVYTWFYFQLIVIDPFSSRYEKGILFGTKLD